MVSIRGVEPLVRLHERSTAQAWLPKSLARTSVGMALVDGLHRSLGRLPARLAQRAGLTLTELSPYHYVCQDFLMQLPCNLEGWLEGVGPLAHPVGLGAGYDRNGLFLGGLKRVGFSFIELGSVTPSLQLGVEKESLQRYPSTSLIHCNVLKSEGFDRVAARLTGFRAQGEEFCIGVSLGKSLASTATSHLEELLSGISAFSNVASYFVLPLSLIDPSPEKGLQFLEGFCQRLETVGGPLGSFWVKLAPNLSKKLLQDAVELSMRYGLAGLFLGDSYEGAFFSSYRLSGPPLATMATQALEWAYEVHEGALPMVSSGGISSGLDVFHRIERGACAVQIYTSLFYRGPSAVRQILLELCGEMCLRGVKKLSALQGSFYLS